MQDLLKEISGNIDKHADALKQNISSELRFVRNWLRAPLKTGAIAASSRPLGKRMASFIDPASSGPVLELGPGTGVFTQALIDRGITEERLILVEFNPDFARHLRIRFPKATIIRSDAYDSAKWLSKCPEPFAGIVSGLPLLTRPPLTRRRLIESCLAYAQADAPFVQFTYMPTPPVAAFDNISASQGPTTFYNLPPARIWVYRKHTH